MQTAHPLTTRQAIVQKANAAKGIAQKVNDASAVHVTVMAVTVAGAVIAQSAARKKPLRVRFLNKISLLPLWNLHGVLLNL